MLPTVKDTNSFKLRKCKRDHRVFHTVTKNVVLYPFFLGMIDIAIATVADLYEDNGGIPATLQFPKLEDVKADVNKVSAGGLRPGQAVIINNSTLCQTAALPGFAVPDMKKTFGLTGVVKNVDKVCLLLSVSVTVMIGIYF